MADDQPGQTIYEDQADGSTETSTEGALNVARNGVTVVANAKTTNFTGSVTVTDAGADQADIDIQGAGGSFNRYDIGARLTAGSGSIENVAIPSLRDLITPAVSDVVLGVDIGAGNELVQIQLDNLPGGGGGGEVNTASNVGTGQPVFKQKTGVDLELRTIKDAGNNRISVVLSISGDEVELDVVPSAILLQTMGGAVTVPGQISAGGTPSGTTFLRGDGQWETPAGGTGDVDSVFTRTGDVVAVSGDYTGQLVTSSLSTTAYTPAGSLLDDYLAAIDVALGAGGGTVSSWNGRTGDVVPLTDDYDFNQLTISGPLDAQGQPSTEVLYQQLFDTAVDGQFWFTREDGSGNYTWKVGATEAAAGVVMVMTTAGNMITSGTFDGRDVGSDGSDQDDLITLSGVAAGSVDLGTFTEGIIPANSDDKEALQALETEFRAPAVSTRTAQQNNLGGVTETGTFEISGVLDSKITGARGHYKTEIKLENPITPAVMQLPAPDDAQFAGLEQGHFCDIRVASGSQSAEVTALVADTFRHANGYSSAITIGDEDTVFLGFDRASAFGQVFQLHNLTDLWVLYGPFRITETDSLTLDLAIQDSATLQLNHCDRLNFSTNLGVTVVGRTATIDATGGAASGTYVGLTDTPASFAGDAEQFVRVNTTQTALEHVAGETIADLPAQTGLDTVNDLVAIWDASAQDTVNAAIDDLVGSVGVASWNGRTGTVVPVSADYTAAQVTNAPAGGIAATDVQAAITELDTEKSAIGHQHTLADVTDSGALAALNTVGSAEIDANSVDFTKQADIATQTIVGRTTAATGDPEALTVTQALAVLGVEAGAAAPPYDTADLVDGAATFAKQGDITSQRLVGRTTAATGDPEEIQIDALPAQVSPVATDSLLAQRQADGALIKIAVGDLPSAGGGAVDSVFTRSGDVIAVAGDYTAALVTNAPAGNIAATDVQAALNELDAEKALLAHQHTLADVTDSGALAALNTVGTAEIDNDAVTLAKLANIATASFLGRITAATGDPEVLTATQSRSILNVADGATANTGALADLDTVGSAQIDANAVGPSELAATAVTPGAFTRANVTVDQEGRVTAAANGSGDAVTSVFTRTGAVVAAAGDYTGALVTNTPAGFVAATTVQAAIDEIDAEKPQISTEDELVGQMQLAVVATLPGTPDANTLYFVTT